MIRLGLCCQFVSVPIRFRTTTATYLQKVGRKHVEEIVRHNVQALLETLEWCHCHGIGSFRITSKFLPVASHPKIGYRLTDLGVDVEPCRKLAQKLKIRLTFHPDQFVVLNSQKEEVVEAAIRDLEVHGELAHALGADIVNIHAGGRFGDKKGSLERLARNLNRLSKQARQVLTLENDDVSFSPEDLLPLCQQEGIPFVYDVHHHRCLPDSLTIQEATQAALKTWDREPLFHISSPLGGIHSSDPTRHAGWIRWEDFPEEWKSLPDFTLEVEAKEKEKAVLRLQKELRAIHLT